MTEVEEGAVTSCFLDMPGLLCHVTAGAHSSRGNLYMTCVRLTYEHRITDMDDSEGHTSPREE